jgi:fatty-acyl-CoA synthase
MYELPAAFRAETMWQIVEASAHAHPDRNAHVAIDDAGEIRRQTYAALVDRVQKLSAGLASIGVRRGDRVVLWMTNRLEWIVSYLAVVRLGATLVPVNTFLKPPEIAYVIAQSQARHLIMMDGFRNLDMRAMLREICPAFGADPIPGHLMDDAFPDLRTVIEFNRHGAAGPHAFDWRTLAQVSSPQAAVLADEMAAGARPTDLAMVKYTSGSTGFPKGVMLEQGGIVANARAHSRRVGIDSNDIFFSMMPFFHGGGSIWGLTTMLVNGGTLVFTESFNPDYAADLIADEKATVLMGVLAAEIVDAAIRKGRTFESLRIAQIPNEDARRIMPNVQFCIYPFGLTETYGPAAANCLADPPDRRMSTAGRMLEGNELRVVDPDTGRDVPPGTPGEALIRGMIFRGYWNKPEATAKALPGDGWLHSEDLVRVDADGYIQYVGRIKLMLKVGGENVSIEEVERVVASHPDVVYCGVVGVPDKRKVERARAYVTVRNNAVLSEESLIAWLKPQLAVFKMPREIIFVDELPRLANGKIDRMTLKRIATDQDAAA